MASRQVCQCVCRVVGIKALDDVFGDFFGAQRSQQGLADVFFQFGNDLRLGVGVKQTVEVQRFFLLERVENVGHVPRVKVTKHLGKLHVASFAHFQAEVVEEFLGQLKHGAKVAFPTPYLRFARKKADSKAADSSAKARLGKWFWGEAW